MPFVTSCRHILIAHYDHSSVAEAVEFNGIILLRLTSCVILFLLILKNKSRAGRENGRRAGLLVLPSYYPLVWVTIAYYFLFALLHLMMTDFGDYVVLISLDVAVSHTLTEGLAFFLMQHGAGVYAFQRSLVFATGAGIFSFFIFYFIFTVTWDDNDSYLTRQTYFAHAMFSALVLSFYILIVIIPERILYRRPALNTFAKYCIIENAVWLLASSLIYTEDTAGYCTVLAGEIIFISILHPIVFIRSLAKDSEFWQGCYVPSGGNRSPVHDTWDINLEVATTMGTVLSDMQRQVKSLPVIHFSSIEFSVKKFISGGLSRVYFVTDFYLEVQVMYQLQHENIVKCLGISVMPPTICVVLELCPYGSLYDYIYDSDDNECGKNSTLSTKSLLAAASSSMMTARVSKRHEEHHVTPQPSQRNAIELGAASPQNGISPVQNPLNSQLNTERASMHNSVDYDEESTRGTLSSSRAFSVRANKFMDNFFKLRSSSRLTLASGSSAAGDHLHRSRKTAKLECPRYLTTMEKYHLMLGACRGIAFLHSKGFMHCDIKSPNFLIAKDKVVKLADLGEARRVDVEYQSPPFPAYNWAPPELFHSDVSKRIYSTASDIYGLSMVFSEILTHTLPLEDIFLTCTVESQLYHCLVAENMRPALPAEIPDCLRSLIVRGWDSEASVRPSADEIMLVLERLCSKMCADL